MGCILFQGSYVGLMRFMIVQCSNFPIVMLLVHEMCHSIQYQHHSWVFT